jgi:quercetin dioxygenase-like cupin family protein
MLGDQIRRTHPRGETTGTSQRPAQRLDAPILTFDLFEELEQLRREETWQRETHNANTLVKEPDLRVVLIALKTGGRLGEHHSSGRLTIQTISGQIRLHLPDQTVDLPAGHLLALDSQIAHDVEALEESAFLLTIAWPEERPAAV